MLSRHERRRPKQASLRRAVSTAYYALFHLLCSEAASRMIRSSDHPELLRGSLRRAFHHGVMREVCGEATKLPQGRLRSICCGHPGTAVLQRIAKAFIDLQEARHEADYDVLAKRTRIEVIQIVGQAQSAFNDWNAIRLTPLADAFLVALLTGVKR